MVSWVAGGGVASAVQPDCSRTKYRPRTVQAIPIPPQEMRDLIGGVPPDAFDNPTGEPVYPQFELERRHVFDFGSGCGRIARQLMQQREPVASYVGVDIHRGMVRWCQKNFSPVDGRFRFLHHDISHPTFNPGRRKPDVAPLPGATASVDTAFAVSVFTHIIEANVKHCLREMSRILMEGGSLLSTWFFFDRSNFPMLQTSQHALYINTVDVTNAVLYDPDWVRSAAREVGLTITRIDPPDIRGFHWWVLLTKTSNVEQEALMPADDAPVGHHPAPVGPARPHAVD